MIQPPTPATFTSPGSVLQLILLGWLGGSRGIDGEAGWAAAGFLWHDEQHDNVQEEKWAKTQQGAQHEDYPHDGWVYAKEFP